MLVFGMILSSNIARLSSILEYVAWMVGRHEKVAAVKRSAVIEYWSSGEVPCDHIYIYIHQCTVCMCRCRRIL